MPISRRAPLQQALAWVFAVLCCVVAFAVASPRASAFDAVRGDRTASVALSPAHDLGKAVARQVRALTVAAPAPEPLPPLVPPHHAPARAQHFGAVFDAPRLAAVGTAVRVVRWQRHIPRMDAGEPPRSDASAS